MGKITSSLTLTVFFALAGCSDDSVIEPQAIENQAPTAAISADDSGYEGSSVFVNGEQSADEDGSIASYQWSQLDGTDATFTSTDSASTTIILPMVSADEELIFQLQVTDDDSASSTVSFTITVLNDATNPDISTISVAEGSYGIGASATITITAANSESGLQLQSGSSFNDQELTGFAEVADTAGTYTATYTVVSGNSDWPASTTVDTGTSITLVDVAGNASATITEVDLGANTSIDANAPTAKAGNNKIVNEATGVALDAGESFDAYANSIASYSWEQFDYIDDHEVSLTFTSNTNDSQATFTTPEDVAADTTLTFLLTVADSVGNRDTDTIEILVNNAPTANAGIDQQVNEGAAVTLDGTNSSDTDGDTIARYNWVQVADSSGGTLDSGALDLQGSDASTATFTAPSIDADTTLYFQLTVTDGDGASSSNVVAIAINDGPTVTLDSSNPVEVNESANNESANITLSGRASDSDGIDVDEYVWEQIDSNGNVISPAEVTLDDDNATANFTAPSVDQDTILTFQLTATDNKGGTGSAIAEVLVNNSPTLDLDDNIEFNEKTAGVTITATATDDTFIDDDSKVASYSWIEVDSSGEQVSASSVTDLSGIDTSTISFTTPSVDLDTTLTFQLTVTDNDGASTTDSIIVTINNSPTAEAGSDQEVNESVTVVTLSGSDSSDTDTDSGSSVVGYSWVQVKASSSTEGSEDEVVAVDETEAVELTVDKEDPSTATFSAPEVVVDDDNDGVVTLTFQLTVTDNDGATHSDLVEVAVHNLPVVESVYLIDGAYGIDDTATVYIRAGDKETGLELKEGSSFNVLKEGAEVVDGESDGLELTSFSEIGDGLYSATYQVLETHDSVINGGEATTNITLVDQTTNAHASLTTTAVTLEGEYIDTVRPAVDFITIADGAYGIDDEMTLYIQVEGNEAGLVIKDITEIASFNAGDFDGSDFSFNGVSLYTRDDNGDFVTDDDGNYLPIFEDIGNGTYQTIYTVGSAVNGETEADRDNGAKVPIAITLTDPAGNDSDSTTQITTVTLDGESIYANNPTADAGEEYMIGDDSYGISTKINEEVQVTLDGSDSSDTFNSTENLTYSWELTSISGDISISIDSITIDNSTTAHPTFTTPEVSQDTELTFQLTVTDAGGNKDTDTIVITVNGPPTATIVVSSVNGESTDDGYTDDGYLVNEGDTVTLSATGSDDIETYNWTQVDSSGSALESATVSLSIDDDIPDIATFTAPNNLTSDTTLYFQLTVTDDGDASSTATAIVLVNNAPDVSISVAEGVSIGGDGSLNINEGDSVALQGSGSDSAGATLTYKWEQINSGSDDQELSTNASYTFDSSSELTADASYTLRFTVIDEHGASSSQHVVINVNNYPTASASVDPTELNEGYSVTLDGTGNDTDNDNDTVTHSWHSVDDTGAIGSLLTETEDYEFTAPTDLDSDTSYTFRYTVTDNDGASTSAAADIVLNVNNSPTAVATAEPLVNENATGSLDGSSSSDTDAGSISSYQWLQVDADGNGLTGENSLYAGTIITDGSDITQASFTAPEVDKDETLYFQLTVTDDDDAQHSTTISTLINAAPEVSISTSTGTTQITEGDSITLQGTGSDTTTVTEALIYQWQQVNADSSTTDLNNPKKDYTFVSSSELSADASHTFRFTVTDEHGASDSEDITIDVDNTAPSISLDNTSDTEADEGESGVALDASASSGGITSYLWQQVGDNGDLLDPATVDIDDPNSAETTFTSPSALTTATSIYFRLTVADDDADTQDNSATVTFNIANSVLPAVTALADFSANEGATDVALSIATSSGGISSYGWTQIDIGTNPAVTITPADSADPTNPSASFTAPSDLTETITLTFRVDARDDDANTASDTVEVTINNSILPTADVSATTTIVTEGETGVSLDGSTSSGGISSYKWEQLSAGDNEVQISNDTSATASFTAPEVIATDENEGQITLTFQLTVDDSTNSSTDTVEITVKNQPAISSVTATAADGSVNDSSKIYAIGDVINVYIQASNAEAGLVLGENTTFNGKELEGFGHINGGLYKATYTVEDGDEDVQSDGSVIANITLTDGYNASETHTAVALDGASIDAKAPVITGASILDSGSYTVGDLITIYIYSQESEGNAVAVNANSTVASATLSDPQLLAGSSGNVYTAVYQVQEGDSVSDNTLTASIILTDSAGNDSEAWTTVDVPDNFTIDASSPTQTISDIALSADTGLTNGTGADDFITKTASQTITATLSPALGNGDSLYGSVDSGASWTDVSAINGAVNDTAISWTTELKEGTYNIVFQVRDSSGNEGEATIQQYTLDAQAPTVVLAETTITASEASTATLDGSTSSDNDGGTGIASYSWVQVESGGGDLGDGSTVLGISDASSASTTATTPVLLNDDGSLDEGTENVSFYFQLTIEDLAGNSVTTSTETSGLLTLTVSNYITPDITATPGTAPDFDQISLSWDADSSLTYSLYRSTQDNCFLDNYPACASPALYTDGSGISITDNSASVADSGLAFLTSYYYWLETKRDSTVIALSPAPGSSSATTATSATTSGPQLNDTGVVAGGDYPSGFDTHNDPSTTACDGGYLDSGNSNAFVEFTNEDCEVGRDTDNYDDTDGHAGFSFTRLNFDGSEYSGTGEYMTQPWSCVIDNVTGLVWEIKTTNGGTSDASNQYTWHDGSTDTESSQDTGDLIDLAKAENSGQGLCGQTNWRLATVQEIESLGSYNSVPAIDKDYFPNTQGSDNGVNDYNKWYWTAEVDSSNNPWAYNAYAGSTASAGSGSTYYVRLVSSSDAVGAWFSDYSDSRYTDNGDGTISDQHTGLMWMKCTYGLSDTNCGTGTAASGDWEAAFAAADTSNAANSGSGTYGHTDWRLPNKKELSSIVDLSSTSSLTVNQTIFPSTQSADYWTSTPSSTGSADEAFTIDFATGTYRAATRSTTNTIYVRLVRDID